MLHLKEEDPEFYITKDWPGKVDLSGNSFKTTCPNPNCAALNAATLVSVPLYNQIDKLKMKTVGMVYCCISCNEPIYVRHEIVDIKFLAGQGNVYGIGHGELVNRQKTIFDGKSIPTEILEIYIEALICFDNNAYNAYAGQCRKTIQAIMNDYGISGSSKIQRQIEKFADIPGVDEDIVEIIKLIVLSGHDGVHPHLPKMNESRANILFTFMDEVFDQLYYKKNQIEKAKKLRQDVIDGKRNNLNNQ